MSTISSSNNIIFSRICTPLNRYTFKSPKILQWLQDYCRGETVLNLFAGKTVITHPINCVCLEIRNDIDDSMIADFHMDALMFMKFSILHNSDIHVVVLDPPYSYRKSMELYNGHRNSRFKQVLDEIEKLKSVHTVITFGYHSSVMSKKRGFKIVEILLISHGGAQHDTIATVEERI